MANYSNYSGGSGLLNGLYGSEYQQAYEQRLWQEQRASTARQALCQQLANQQLDGRQARNLPSSQNVDERQSLVDDELILLLGDDG